MDLNALRGFKRLTFLTGKTGKVWHNPLLLLMTVYNIFKIFESESFGRNERAPGGSVKRL